MARVLVSCALLLLSCFLAIRAETFITCGCNDNYECINNLAEWQAVSPYVTVSCLGGGQCKSNGDLKNDQKSACLVFDYNENDISQSEAESLFTYLQPPSFFPDEGYCFLSSTAQTCAQWNEELEEYIRANKELEDAVKTGVAIATGVLVAIILVPILLIALIVGLIVWCCCCRKSTNVVVVHQNGQSQPMVTDGGNK
eukprot:CAMPEP_0177757770 /NCGR_PEP_ID=MMETSP0491_2-20121128/3818_1 /TAXON_ID=63592 /ORGANISM="Tetraselmis chuii, Strain PLY429" /LENGTH=197 /DNA_ID=CAMNT_0019273439 /DNA_START=237 /DNA_END=830 /DNA_ORIENTATION=-